MANSTLQLLVDTVKDAAANLDQDQIARFTGQNVDSVDEFMARTERRGPRNFGKALLAGVIGGLVGVGVKMIVDRQLAPDRRQVEDDYAEAAVDAAESFTNVHLTEQQQDVAEVVAEFGFGAVIGGAYGMVVEAVPTASKMGTDQLMATTKSLALPAIGIAPAAVRDVAEDKIGSLAGHVAFGATTEIVRRAVRYYLDE
ncbi:MAG: hypothetical protein AAFN92_04770 [Bacteroidota bacterium]